MIWISFSVRTTFLDNTFCQLHFSENLQNELSYPIERPIDNWEQNKDKLRTTIKYDMLIKISFWLSRAITRIRLIISAAPFLVFIFPFALVQLTRSKGVIEVSVKSLQVRLCLHQAGYLLCQRKNHVKYTLCHKHWFDTTGTLRDLLHSAS